MKNILVVVTMFLIFFAAAVKQYGITVKTERCTYGLYNQDTMSLIATGTMLQLESIEKDGQTIEIEECN